MTAAQFRYDLRKFSAQSFEKTRAAWGRQLMDEEGSVTLYDAIKGQEEHFQEVVLKGISAELAALGDRIYDLEWANIAVAAQEQAKAA